MRGIQKIFLQMVNLWERYPVIEEYVHNVRVAELARRLTRSKSVRLWHDQALIKYPKESKPTAWHQDTVYWPMNEREGCRAGWLLMMLPSTGDACGFFRDPTNWGLLRRSIWETSRTEPESRDSPFSSAASNKLPSN